jgi:hypothetical protein
MSSLPSTQQLKELGREQWKEYRSSLCKNLQESGDLKKVLTSRFPYPSLQGGGDGCQVPGPGEGAKLLSNRSTNHLFDRLRMIIARKYFYRTA